MDSSFSATTIVVDSDCNPSNATVDASDIDLTLQENVPSTRAPQTPAAATSKAKSLFGAATQRITRTASKIAAAFSGSKPASAAPSTAARPTRRGSTISSGPTSSASWLVGLEPRAAVATLLGMAAGARAPGADNWPKQDAFITAALECVRAHAKAGEVAAALGPHAGAILASIATALSCARSNTQKNACHLVQALASLAGSLPPSALRDTLAKHVEELHPALLGLVASAAGVAGLVATGQETIKALMKHVAAGKITGNLAKDYNGNKFDTNQKVQEKLVVLMAEGLSMLARGHFCNEEDQESSERPSLQPLPQGHYADLIKAIVKINKNARPQQLAHLRTLISCLIAKGQTNNVLTSERRELARMDRSAFQTFDELASKLCNATLPTVTRTAPESSPTRGRSASIAVSSTSELLGSPLPASARKNARIGGASASAAKPTYAATMPSEILSPAQGVFPEPRALEAASAAASPTTAAAGIAAVPAGMLMFSPVGSGSSSSCEGTTELLEGSEVLSYSYVDASVAEMEAEFPTILPVPSFAELQQQQQQAQQQQQTPAQFEAAAQPQSHPSPLSSSDDANATLDCSATSLLHTFNDSLAQASEAAATAPVVKNLVAELEAEGPVTALRLNDTATAEEQQEQQEQEEQEAPMMQSELDATRTTALLDETNASTVTIPPPTTADETTNTTQLDGGSILEAEEEVDEEVQFKTAIDETSSTLASAPIIPSALDLASSSPSCSTVPETSTSTSGGRSSRFVYDRSQSPTCVPSPAEAVAMMDCTASSSPIKSFPASSRLSASCKRKAMDAGQDEEEALCTKIARFESIQKEIKRNANTNAAGASSSASALAPITGEQAARSSALLDSALGLAEIIVAETAARNQNRLQEQRTYWKAKRAVMDQQRANRNNSNNNQ